jgi:hypothetical protein
MMFGYSGLRNTIETANDVELPRGTVVLVLGEVEQRRRSLNMLDPTAEPAFGPADSARTQGVLGRTHEL